MENENENIKITPSGAAPATQPKKYKCTDCGHIGPAGLDYRPPGILRSAATVALGGMLLGNYLLNKAGKKAAANMFCCSKCKSRNIEEWKGGDGNADLRT